MNKLKKVGVALVCVLGIVLVAITVALFHGYFDHGNSMSRTRTGRRQCVLQSLRNVLIVKR